MLDLADSIELVLSDTTDPNDRLRERNPLGKIPTLVLEDGRALYDSHVILEYLDHLAGGGVIVPGEPRARFAALTRQTLADGLMDAAVLQVYEKRFRDEHKREPRWVAHQAAKVDRALAAVERSPPAGVRTVADIALACALGYLDLRFEGQWRGSHPALVDWLQAFAAEVPAFAATAFVG